MVHLGFWIPFLSSLFKFFFWFTFLLNANEMLMMLMTWSSANYLYYKSGMLQVAPPFYGSRCFYASNATNHSPGLAPRLRQSPSPACGVTRAHPRCSNLERGPRAPAWQPTWPLGPAGSGSGCVLPGALSRAISCTRILNPFQNNVHILQT